MPKCLAGYGARDNHDGGTEPGTITTVRRVMSLADERTVVVVPGSVPQSAAMQTDQDVDRKRALHEPRTSRARAALGLASVGRGRGIRF